MKCEGYKLSGYDATYKKTMFNVVEQGNRVLEITDLDGGVTFLVSLEDYKTKQKPRTRKWKQKEDAKHGVSIAYKGKALTNSRTKV